jgi:hypothetical protein
MDQQNSELKMFKHGETVRFIGDGWTPSQRQCLWVVEFENRDRDDWGASNVKVYRQTDPDCIIWAPRRLITTATVLDLLASV